MPIRVCRIDGCTDQADLAVETLGIGVVDDDGHRFALPSGRGRSISGTSARSSTRPSRIILYSCSPTDTTLPKVAMRLEMIPSVGARISVWANWAARSSAIACMVARFCRATFTSADAVVWVASRCSAIWPLI